MKTRKLIDKVRALFDEDLRNSQKMQDSLHEVLEQLRSKEKKLQADIEREQDPENREKLRLKMELVHTQRKKGVAKLKAIRDDAGND